jgi:hypothetical protein
VPEDLVVQDAPEVVQPDVDAVVLEQFEQLVALQRQPDEVVDRVAEDRGKYGDDRQDEQVRRGAVGQPLPAEPPPRPGGRGGGCERGLAPAQESPRTR